MKCDADGQRRPGRPAREVRAAPRATRRRDDHLPLDLRRVRGAREGAVRDRPRARRPRVRRRREPERARRPRRAGRIRRRREPPEPAQDLLHPARWRRPGRRAGVRRRGPGALPAGAPTASASGRPGQHVGAVSAAQDRRRRRLGGAVRQRRRAADQLDVHAHDGRRGPARGDRGRDPQRQLHRGAPVRRLRHPLQRQHRRHQGRRRRARMHPRPAAAEGELGRDRRGRRQAPDRLRLPRADAVASRSPAR